MKDNITVPTIGKSGWVKTPGGAEVYFKYPKNHPVQGIEIKNSNQEQNKSKTASESDGIPWIQKPECCQIESAISLLYKKFLGNDSPSYLVGKDQKGNMGCYSVKIEFTNRGVQF